MITSLVFPNGTTVSALLFFLEMLFCLFKNVWRLVWTICRRNIPFRSYFIRWDCRTEDNKSIRSLDSQSLKDNGFSILKFAKFLVL